MFGSGILDTVIGLLFVFLLVSMLVTIINEAIAALLSSRARCLRRGLARMLGSAWMQKLYDHPLIAGSAEQPSFFNRGPSYIPSRSFANVLVSIIQHEASAGTVRLALDLLPPDDLKKSLLTLYDDASDDVDKFKENVEVWFNNGMDRVNGWYKRRAQVVTMIVALAVAAGMNVDAILVFRHLQTDAAVRNAIVGQATQFAQRPAPDGASAAGLREQFDAAQAQLSSLALPIGWISPASAADRAAGQALPSGAGLADQWEALLLRHGIGWLLTALAATLGAPFWFDMLNRVMSIRSAGKAPEEQPRPPKTVAAPLEPGQSPQEAERARQGDPADR